MAIEVDVSAARNEPKGGREDRNSGDRPAPHSAVSAYPLDDELVVYDSRSAESFVLNSTAADVWDLCDGKRTLEGVVQEFARYHGLSHADAVVDVQRLLEELRGRGLFVS